MAKLVALLRGINVGGHRRVPMADLRVLCRETGFADVESYIQSGNLVFRAADRPDAAAAKLEAALAKRFGFPVDVVARTASQWARYAAGSPFPTAAEKEPNRVALVLSKARPRRGAAGVLAGRASQGERVEAAGDAVWIHYAAGAARSKLTPALLDRALGSPATARNWKTVLALQSMLQR